MAIYHFSGTIISRSQGRSAVACAAYRSASQLQDERYAKTHDYTTKKGVAYTEILLPENAPSSFSFLRDREKLWNAVEAAEKRKDAQLSREFNFALPRELTLSQNIALAREFVETQFVAKGMIVDLCIHTDKSASGESQPHAHVMLTLREVTASGFGQKVRAWNAKENLWLWREAWAEATNRHLFLNGHQVTIDHRTLEAQGIHLEAQYKLGPVAAKPRLIRQEEHQRIAKENGEKLLENPQIALNAITRQQSTFTHQDLARFVNRHTVDAEQFEAVYEKVKSCEQLVSLGKDDLGRERFSTQEMLAIETQMLKFAAELPQRSSHGVSEKAIVSALASKALSEEQRFAFDHLVAAGDLKCVVGYAGTGKSYLLGAAREAWEAQGYRVLGATLSGIAAENLSGSSGIESRTLASRFYYWDKGQELLTSRDILVIDEAGMIGSRQMARILEQADQQKAKVVLIGDPEQLQAIEAGAAFRAVSECTGTVELTDIRRQTDAWQREATRELATGQTEQALLRYEQHDHVHAFATQAEAQENLISLWNDARLSDSSQTQLMLAYTRAEVKELNERARALRRAESELGEDHLLMTVRGERALAVNDRIYFLKNDRGLGVMNGTLATVEAIHDQQITVCLDRTDHQALSTSSARNSNTDYKYTPDRPVTFRLDEYNHIDHGYAATIHKGQGVTVDRSYILASQYLDRHATYVAMTRHRKSADVFYSRDVFANERELTRTLSRERSKDVTLDYLHAADEAKLFSQFSPNREIETASEKTEKAAEKSLFSFHSLDSVNSLSNSSQDSLEKKQLTADEKLVQEAAAYQRLQTQESNPSEPIHAMQAPKARTETRETKEAREIREMSLPRHERLALEAQRRIPLLEKAMAHSHMPRTARDELRHTVAKVIKQPEVMAYLQEHNPAMVQKIEQLDISLSQESLTPAFKTSGVTQELKQAIVVTPDMPLETLLTRYVELELEQTRLVNAMHSARLKDPVGARALSADMLAHSRAIKVFAVQAALHPEMKAELEKLKEMRERPGVRSPSLAERGGFSAIRARMDGGTDVSRKEDRDERSDSHERSEKSEKRALTPEDKRALVVELHHKALEYVRTQARDRDRGRGGRSR